MSKKTKIISAIIALVVAILGGSQLIGGGGSTTVYQTIGGSVDNLCSMPLAFVDDTTTTTAGFADGEGCLWTQDIEVSGITDFTLSGEGLGVTATSSINVRLSISYDGTNFFNITGNSTSTEQISSSTGKLLTKAFSFDPGTASTTFAYPFTIPSANKLRVQVYGEASHEEASLQAFIQLAINPGY